MKMMKCLLCVVPLLFCELAVSQNSTVLHGTITDSTTGIPLVAANIRLLGTAKGTITNTQGQYSLTVEPGTYSFIFSYLAYQPETLTTTLQGSTIHNVALVQSPIQIPEVVVLAEDPALEIIRKAIAYKRRWREKIASYQFDAFTRQVLRRDTSIASITEAYTTGFWRTGDTLREIVRQKRQTENIPSAENFAAVRRIVNFNDDEITLFTIRTNGNTSGYVFTGPTAPDALDNYDYHLVSTSTTNGVEIYRITISPQTRTKPLFSGTITIADGTFAVMGVDVTTNEAFTLPFVKDINLRYRQQFALYDSEFWMPADIRIEGGFSVSFIGLSLPRIGIEATSSIYDYTMNRQIPDSLFKQARVIIDSSATVYDTTFWKTHEVLPLTGEEQQAYTTLDSTQTLEKQFEPKGPLASLGGQGTGSVVDHVDVWFNRVEGFFFGGKTHFDSLSQYVRVQGSAGYGFDEKRFTYEAGATVFTSKERRLGFGAAWYNTVDHVPDNGYYGSFINTLTSLIDKNDYRDYYLAQGYKLFFSAAPTRRIMAALSFFSERNYSLDIQSNYSIFSNQNTYRLNPPVQEGLLRSVRLDVRLGDEPVPLDLVSRNVVELSMEYSSPSFAKSEFDFTRYQGILSRSVRTFGRGLLFPPQLRLTIGAGTSTHNLPPQRVFSLDSRSSGYAPFGVLKGSGVREFSGDRYVMIALEHNFRSIPFLALNIPFLYRNGIELIIHGAFAQMWSSTIIPSNAATAGWYSEAGIGISRILDIFRTDFTYRFKEPKRFFFTISVATLF